MNKNTKKIVIVAMLVAFDVIFSRLLAFNVLIAKVGLGFAATAVCAMLYGPVWAGVCAALADLVGVLLFPTGAYFPGFTVTAAMTGVIYGLFLYKSRPKPQALLFSFADKQSYRDAGCQQPHDTFCLRPGARAAHRCTQRRDSHHAGASDHRHDRHCLIRHAL